MTKNAFMSGFYFFKSITKQLKESEENCMERTVIVGCGDLGSRLANSAIKSGLFPVIYDRDDEVIKKYQDASQYTLNPSLNMTNVPSADAYAICDELEELAGISGIVNFAVPASSLKDFPVLGKAQLGIMHDSVMTNSHSAILARSDAERHLYSIVHLLMNQHAKAILDPDHGDVQKVNDYLHKLGLSVAIMTHKEHDQMMAQSQGAMLKLMVRYGHKLLLLQAARILDDYPILSDLNSSLLMRNAQWTDATILSIVRNPFVNLGQDEVAIFIDQKHKIKANASKKLDSTFLEDLVGEIASDELADEIKVEFTEFVKENIETLTAMSEKGLLTPSSEELLSLLVRNTVLAV